MAVKCAAHDCLHNRNSQCTASVVQIENCRASGSSGNHCCTHTNDPGNYLLTAVERPSHPARAREIFASEAAEEFKVSRRQQNPAVLCGNTDCKYNSQKSCNAENVAIGRIFGKHAPQFPCKTCKIE
jgi:hypothetical protein